MSHALPNRVVGGETESTGVGASVVVSLRAAVISVVSARTPQNLPFPNKCELDLTNSMPSDGVMSRPRYPSCTISPSTSPNLWRDPNKSINAATAASSAATAIPR
ncbi:Uncharacterised protein [Mycobacteroides abscessus subsp. bolletii]|nr:Uncharacterised protein [Mycobacteroides abscessus subsp. bolletii]